MADISDQTVGNIDTGMGAADQCRAQKYAWLRPLEPVFEIAVHLRISREIGVVAGDQQAQRRVADRAGNIKVMPWGRAGSA